MPMNSDDGLFEIVDPLPQPVGSMPMLRFTRADQLVPVKADSRDDFPENVQREIQRFRMPGEPTFKGDRAVVRAADQSLEVYRASDSVWWTDHRLAYVDAPLEPIQLPPMDVAVQRANEHLMALGLSSERLFVASVTHTEASSRPSGDEVVNVNTAIDINYRFVGPDLPIFGPGSKVKVTLGHDAALAQVVYFSRAFEPDGDPFQPITPQDAITRFTRDVAFFRLRGTAARIIVKRIRLGYYALPPDMFQRYYIPVYAIDATCDAPPMRARSFRRYVVARDLSTREAKRMRIVANPAACRIF
jgi:hypothetical protein